MSADPAGLRRGAWRLMVGVVVLVALLPACGSRGDPAVDLAPAGVETTTVMGDNPDPESDSTGISVTPGPALPDPLCQSGEGALVTDLQAREVPAIDEPKARVPYRDPEFGACVVRVTDRLVDLDVLGTGDPSIGLKNEYSRAQSSNADGSLMVVRSIEQEWYLYDAASLTPVGHLPIPSEPRWDPADPGLIYYPDESRLMIYDIGRSVATVLHDFQQDFTEKVTVSTRDEGRPSMDGRYFGLMARNEDWEPIGFLIYDKDADTSVIRDVTSLSGIEEGVDFVTISPVGTTFIAGFDRYCQEGEAGTDTEPCGLMAYDADLTNGRSVVGIAGHHDLALDADGREVAIYQDIATDHISMVDLATGTQSDLFPIDFSHSAIGLHFSGVAYDRPGWAVISTYNGDRPRSSTWMDDQVFLVEMRPEGRVVRVAHTHSVWTEDVDHDYWAEPQASSNRDLTRILFTSNWGRSGTEEVEMYLIELPADWDSRLPDD